MSTVGEATRRITVQTAVVRRVTIEVPEDIADLIMEDAGESGGGHSSDGSTADLLHLIDVLPETAVHEDDGFEVARVIDGDFLPES